MDALALALDAVAIAGQALIGRLLGAGDTASAWAAGRRMLELGAVTGVVAGALVLARPPGRSPTCSPTTPPSSPSPASCSGTWPPLQPLNGLAFVLDGLLIGAGDLRFLATAMAGATAVFAVAAGAVLVLDLGIGWLWAAIGIFMGARAIPLLLRWRSGKWAVVGATR